MGIAYKGLVVEVMELGAGPDREPLGRSPGVLVAVVVLNGLVETPEEEEVHAEDVVHEDERSKHGTETEDQSFEGMSILSGHADRHLEFVVNLVDVLVPGSVVEEAMYPVEVKVLNKEGEDRSSDDVGPRGQMSIRTNSNVGGDEVENEHHGELEDEMTHQQLLDTLQMAREGDNFVLFSKHSIKVSLSPLSIQHCTFQNARIG